MTEALSPHLESYTLQSSQGLMEAGLSMVQSINIPGTR